jgi:carboxyl-terminal processing protease
MARAVKHLVLLGLTMPAALLGYHVLAGGSGTLGSSIDPTRHFTDLVGEVTGTPYRLGELNVFERDLFYVEQRYVDRDRINLDTMFQAALERVERAQAGVLFARTAGSPRLQVSVGTFNTVLAIEPIRDFDTLHGELRQVASILDEHLPEDVDRADVEYDLINGALSTLDPHSLLLPPVAAREMEVDNQGEFGGLGIEIHIKDGRLTVKQPLEGTPAERSGMRAGDQIIRIEDESTVNMDLQEAVSRLRGEVGSPVRILVKRKHAPDPIPKTIVRARIKLNPVEGQLLDDKVGYIVIKSFHGKVSDELDMLLDQLKRQAGGALNGLVLDLRDNPGGYLTEAVNVSDRFIKDGVIVATEEGGGRREEQQASRAGAEIGFPMAVLVNGNSASASEIVAGALKNLGRAVVVGERTFGKGSVQHLYPNRDDSSLKLTVARYLTPGDHSIQAIGIPPDVLLEPSVVWSPEAESEDRNPLVSLYYRQWVEREADLDRALGNQETLDDSHAYAVRFVRERQDPDKISKAVEDWEVEFVRDLVSSARGPTRVDVLQSAGSVVERYAGREEARLVGKFESLGMDWSAGENPETLAVTVAHDLGSDGILRAGEPEDITLTITNDGEQPLWRISAVTHSTNPYLDEREFYFGHIPPGASRTARQRMSVPHGQFNEHVAFEVEVRDPGRDRLGTFSRSLDIRGDTLPEFAWRLRLVDDGSGETKGDGDGLPEVGEVVALEVEVENTGAGAARDAYVRLKNKSGRPLDLENGTIRAGAPVDDSGEACDPELDDRCTPTLEPGAHYTGRLVFSLRDLPEDGAWSVQLSVGDNERFDRGTVIRGGFYEFFQLQEDILLTPGKPVDEAWRRPPTIEITRAPDLITDDAVISGMVRDDRGVRDVVVFQDKDKVFYRGGDADPVVPFSVEPTLSAGDNLFAIIARDDQGLTATRSISVWNPGSDQVATDHRPDDSTVP